MLCAVGTQRKRERHHWPHREPRASTAAFLPSGSCASQRSLLSVSVPHPSPAPLSPHRLSALLPPPRAPVPLDCSSCLNVPRGSLPNDPRNTRFRLQNYLDVPSCERHPSSPQNGTLSALSYIWRTQTLQNADMRCTYYLQIRFFL